MPSFLPEGNVSLPSDDVQRSLLKLVDLGVGTGSGGGTGLSGAGSPEGVTTASPGTTYLNTADNSFWAKATGSGTNTGWIQLVA